MPINIVGIWFSHAILCGSSPWLERQSDAIHQKGDNDELAPTHLDVYLESDCKRSIQLTSQ
jgi:hypothetical protein